jgi:hypothetical protein
VWHADPRLDAIVRASGEDLDLLDDIRAPILISHSLLAGSARRAGLAHRRDVPVSLAIISLDFTRRRTLTDVLFLPTTKGRVAIRDLKHRARLHRRAYSVPSARPIGMAIARLAFTATRAAVYRALRLAGC